MHHVFQRFVEHLNESHEPDAFRQAMAHAALAFDLPCFAYLRMPRDDQALAALISTYPVEWTDHYLKRHYERRDPVIRVAHVQTEPFEWGFETGPSDLTSVQREFFAEAADFGIRCGYTIPIQDPKGPIAAVTFASDVRKPAFQRSIAANGLVLQLMAISLHSNVRRKLWRDPVINGVELKPRECDCLRWAAKGKTAWEIAQILDIPERTVTFHLANVRAKLGVSTLRQAVAIYVSALS